MIFDNLFEIEPRINMEIGLTNFLGNEKTGFNGGTPCEIRTHDLRYRKPMLYPAELRVHIL